MTAEPTAGLDARSGLELLDGGPTGVELHLAAMRLALIEQVKELHYLAWRLFVRRTDPAVLLDPVEDVVAAVERAIGDLQAALA